MMISGEKSKNLKLLQCHFIIHKPYFKSVKIPKLPQLQALPHLHYCIQIHFTVKIRNICSEFSLATAAHFIVADLLNIQIAT
jgi:peptidase E